MQQTIETPRVRLVPPAYFMIWLAAGFVLTELLPRVALTEAVMVWGWGVIFIAASLNLWTVKTVKKAQTPLHIRRHAEAIVTDGPYRFSRNPLYLSMVLCMGGFALIADKFWLVALLPFLVLFLNRAVIKPEERYLVARFGTDYVAYQGAVRRWI